ncbi:DUF1565 domain-containing protein [Ochrovirga pacifica]|uniref:DUF1565 domain-containing protein n=1 Tax=Ochrovirga pacifica TaxID=1042376 RepID=UPI000255A54A|nr:DUF1565 domain-containing protein [Ochrovirga pacifica]
MKYFRNFFLVALTLTTLNIFATEYHVSKKGKDSNNGSLSTPFLTIQKAATIAKAGDLVIVHGGTYREEVNPIHGGTSNTNRITYQAALNEKVYIKGSEIINNWQPLEKGVWKAEVPNTFFGKFNPYADEVIGDWFDGKKRKHHTGTVYSEGIWMIEAEKKEDVYLPKSKTNKEYTSWFASVNDTTTTIWAQFGTKNPNQTLTEINVRQTVFYPRKPFTNYITISGFHLMHAAPKWAPPTAEQMGLIGTHWSKGWIIENNTITHSINAGVSLGKYGDKYDNSRKAYNKVKRKTPGMKSYYIASIERARNEMKWNEKHIGSHIVRNNEIAYCEQVGIVGSMGASFSTIIGNHIHHIHTQRRFAGAEMAGIKFHAPVDMLIKGNRIHHTSLALWLDWMTQGTRVSANLFYKNGMDLYFEVNHGPYLVDNNICLSPKSRHLSQGGAFVHNLFVNKWGNWIDYRETPYFKPHSTIKVDDHKITIGDDRFMNNIFVGNGNAKDVLETIEKPKKKKTFYFSYGLQCYNFRPQLATTEGNVYFNKALPQDKEKAIVLDENPQYKLTEEKEGVYLTFNISPKKLDNNKIVNSKKLGKASVTQQRFENKDGSNLVIDQDYLGNKISKKHVYAGPFQHLKKGIQKIKVW